jgi:glycosyltransferase involved in cell wall biosynthesis
VLLDPGWLAANADAFDLLHVHFGFEYYDPDRLREVCAALRRLGKPLVHTVHDLRNPNHASPELHDAGLAVWTAHADALVTLTPWAAAELRRRFDREALVLPHPHVVPIGELRRRQARARPASSHRFRVGVHFKSLRANMVGAPVLRAVLAGAAAVEGTQVVVNLHRDVLDPAGANHDPALVAAALEAARGPADLHIHDYCTDDELWAYLESVDAVVLPYRFGTHSGWMEAAKDLGTVVIAPTCGGYGDQGAQLLFDADEGAGVDSLSLAAAVRAAALAGRPDPIPAAVRDAERRAVAAAHARLYREVLDRVRVGA